MKIRKTRTTQFGVLKKARAKSITAASLQSILKFSLNSNIISKKFNKNSLSSALNRRLKKKKFYQIHKIPFYFTNLKKSVLLFRPILNFTRFDINQLCHFYYLPIYPDQTNNIIDFKRNRIRKQLLPIFRTYFNKNIDATLIRFLEISLYEKNFFYQLKKSCKLNILKKKNPVLTILQNQKINHFDGLLFFLPKSIRNKLLYQILKSTH